MKKIKKLIKRYRKGIATLYKTYFLCLDESRFGYVGDNVTLNPPLILSNPKNIFLYGGNKLDNAKINTTNAKFIMKINSRAAEGLTVSTGNHAMVLGRFYNSIKEFEKPKGFDKDVVVEEDVWIGRNVTLLSGVHIGRGCTIGAGSIVTRNIPPYTVCVGNPARPIKFKWTIDEILMHEKELYSENERFSRDELQAIFNNTQLK